MGRCGEELLTLLHIHVIESPSAAESAGTKLRAPLAIVSLLFHSCFTFWVSKHVSAGG